MRLRCRALEKATCNCCVNDIFQGRAPGRILGVDVEAEETTEDHLQLVQTLHWQGPIEWSAPERRKRDAALLAQELHAIGRRCAALLAPGPAAVEHGNLL